MFLPIPTLLSLDVGIHGRKAFLCQHLVYTHLSIPHFSSTPPFSLRSKGGLVGTPVVGEGGFTPFLVKMRSHCVGTELELYRISGLVHGSQTDRQEQPYRNRTVPCGKLHVGVIRLYHNTEGAGGGGTFSWCLLCIYRVGPQPKYDLGCCHRHSFSPSSPLEQPPAQTQRVRMRWTCWCICLSQIEQTGECIWGICGCCTSTSMTQGEYYNDLLLTSVCLGTMPVVVRDLPGYMNGNP